MNEAEIKKTEDKMAWYITIIFVGYMAGGLLKTLTNSNFGAIIFAFGIVVGLLVKKTILRKKEYDLT